jgi:hypothetical protein
MTIIDTGEIIPGNRIFMEPASHRAYDYLLWGISSGDKFSIYSRFYLNMVKGLRRL